LELTARPFVVARVGCVTKSDRQMMLEVCRHR
jgi:hypothetical protein